MSTLSYPPIIENKLPAFIKSEDGITIQIPFKLSKAVSYSDFTHIQLQLKTITTGLEQYKGNAPKSSISYNDINRYYLASFTLTDTQAEKLVVGQFYKAQLAFVNGTFISPLSQVGIIKCTGPATMAISNLDKSINNNNPVDFIGHYINKDVTEKVYSYCFTIYDNYNQIFETSGELIHNNN